MKTETAFGYDDRSGDCAVIAAIEAEFPTVYVGWPNGLGGAVVGDGVADATNACCCCCPLLAPFVE